MDEALMTPELQNLHQWYLAGLIPGFPPPSTELDYYRGWIAVVTLGRQVTQYIENTGYFPMVEHMLPDTSEGHSPTRAILGGDAYIADAEVPQSEEDRETATTKEGCDLNWLEGTNALPAKKIFPGRNNAGFRIRSKKKNKLKKLKPRSATSSLSLSDFLSVRDGTSERQCSDDDLISLSDLPDAEPVAIASAVSTSRFPEQEDTLDLQHTKASRDPGSTFGNVERSKKNKRRKSKGRAKSKLSAFDEPCRGSKEPIHDDMPTVLAPSLEQATLTIDITTKPNLANKSNGIDKELHVIASESEGTTAAQRPKKDQSTTPLVANRSCQMQIEPHYNPTHGAVQKAANVGDQISRTSASSTEASKIPKTPKRSKVQIEEPGNEEGDKGKINTIEEKTNTTDAAVQNPIKNNDEAPANVKFDEETIESPAENEWTQIVRKCHGVGGVRAEEKSVPMISGHTKKHGARKADIKIQRTDLKDSYTENDTEIRTQNFKIFPMAESHEFKIVCDKCLQRSHRFGRFDYVNIVHKCSRDRLAVKKTTAESWRRIRERHNHFRGYIRCQYFSETTPCARGESCGFAHSAEELKLWTLDANNKFSIHGFINWQNNTEANRVMTLAHLQELYPGNFSYVCKNCFISTPPQINQQMSSGQDRCSNCTHHWLGNGLLSHETSTGKVTVITPRPSLKTHYMCWSGEHCADRWKLNGCKQAHSAIERDVWVWERDAKQEQSVLVYGEPENRFSSSKRTATTRAGPSRVTATGSPISVEHHNTQQRHLRMVTAQPPLQQAQETCLTKCRYSSLPNIQEICRKCWKVNKIATKQLTNSTIVRCNHVLSKNKIYYLPSGRKEIREYPGIAERSGRYRMCRQMLNTNACTFLKCTFAHSEEELKIWNWMRDNKVQSVGQIVQDQTYKSAQQVPPIHVQNDAHRNTQQNVDRGISMSHNQTNQIPDTVHEIKLKPQPRRATHYYCVYCSTAYNNQRQLEHHCSSSKHQLNVNSDNGRPWNYRQPPWNVYGGNYRLCADHATKGSCDYSGISEEYNFCRFAHNELELDEWKERWKWRQMKREQSKNTKMFSYMDTLWEEFKASDDGTDILTEGHHATSIVCTSDLVSTLKNKSDTQSWNFEINTNKNQLEKVALLLTEGRSHFSLSNMAGISGEQILSGEDLPGNTNGGDVTVYKIQVDFRAEMYGTFKQWVVFDFGTRPITVRKVQIDVTTPSDQLALHRIRQQIEFDRWTASTKEIVLFEDSPTNSVERKFEANLLEKYKPPDSSRDVIDQDVIGLETTKQNYKRKMHKLLNLEEYDRAGIIAKCADRTTMEVVQLIHEQESGVFEVAPQGQLFGRIPLQQDLSTDSSAGRLILMSVTKVLLKKANDQSNRVYEAQVIVRDRFDGRTQKHIYVLLSMACIADYNLVDNGTLQVEIQFQVDRLPFCKMHLAVDRFTNMNVIFPDVTQMLTPEWQNVKTFELSSARMNAAQTEVVRQILTDRPGPSLPIICYGPFGTGKTETLAQAVMLLVKERNGRILLCTHSNSAADLYITRFFDDYRKTSEMDLIRVYHRNRQTSTVHETVKRYCRLSVDQRTFVMPSPDEVKDTDVVVTTVAAAAYLLQYDELVGVFTHIFVDEAAQVLESEILIPFALASETTKMVIAGDHIQSRPEVFNSTARKQNFDRSILERLFAKYASLKDRKYQTNCLSHLLKINYRTDKTIVKFLATAFYGGPESLVCGKSQTETSGREPIAFYSAQGIETRDVNATSYYNQAEVNEIVSSIYSLCQEWPEEWGPFQPEKIGVVCAYDQQIYKIRSALRAIGLARVNVGPVHSIQGKEFTALFISTVRTRHTNHERPGENVNLGFLSDRHLLNTALTRSESFVGVVGDPVALCSIGECAGIWRAYMRHCQEHNSIHPSHMTMDEIMLEIESDQTMKLRKKGATADKSYYRAASFCWDDNESIPADDILKQLAKEAQQVSESELRKIANVSDEPLQMEYVKISEIGDQAVLSYSPPGWSTFRQKRNLLSADDYDKEYDSDGETSNDDNLANRCEHTEQQLLVMSKQEPERYKRCILHIYSSFRIRARVRDGDDNITEIRISNRKRCGRGYNQDEVLVEVLPKDEEEQKLGTCQDDNLPDGAVIGVINRSIDPRYRKFVCTIDEGYGMIPLNVGYHRMVCLSPSHYAERTKKGGAVCVYTFSSDKFLKFDHVEKIHPSDFGRKLFVVRYLKWEAQFNCPLCIVIDILPPGTDLHKGIDILNLEHFVPKQFRIDTVGQARHIKETFSADKLMNRTDLREQLTITIDPEGSQDLDDALSFEEIQTGECRIGIHISDVSHFLKKDDNLDREAQARGVTFYPSGCDPVPMLPTQLSTDVCSLKPNRDRLSLSLFVHIDAEGTILKKYVEQCIINVKYMLTYKEAEDILSGQKNDKDVIDLQNTLRKLNAIAQHWRKARLGNEALYHFLDHESEESPMAHLLVQEMMLMANREVTAILMEHYPKCTPLRIDVPPDEEELDKWRKEFSQVGRNTVALRQPFLPRGQLCTCKQKCTCIPQEKATKGNHNISIRNAVWDNIMNNLHETTEPYDIANPFNLPEAEIAFGQLYRLKGRAIYVCRGDHHKDKLRHNTLNMEHYTHFTSPIRRYLDVVVHRLLTCIIEDKPCPYTQDEISAVCTVCTNASQRANQYETATARLHLATIIEKRPVIMFPTVETVSDTVIQLRTTGVKCIQTKHNEIRMPALQLCTQPTCNDETKTVVLKWQDRMYVKDLPDEERNPKPNEEHVLNQSRFVVQIPEKQWQDLLRELRSGTRQTVHDACRTAHKHVITPYRSLDDGKLHSEVVNIAHTNQHCRYLLALHPADVLKTQMYAKYDRGILTPSLQMLELTHDVHVCLQHRTNPVECFANAEPEYASKMTYKSPDEYKRLWLKLVGIESAKSAITDDDSFVIQNVDINWSSRNGEIKGYFDVSEEFCEARNIQFGRYAGREDDDVSATDETERKEHMLDYICIQYCDVPGLSRAGEEVERKFNIDFLHSTTWVAHCLSTLVERKKKQEIIRVWLKLLPGSVQIPQDLLLKGHKKRASVQYILKSLPKWREEVALQTICARSELAMSIAVGKKTPDLSESHIQQARHFARHTIKGLHPANDSQQKAIDQAMAGSFTLIQGPPGTGKTVTGVRLANLFALFNRSQLTDGKTRPQVMYCGPSNKSVDVVAEYLLKQGPTAPKIVRVYGSLIEKEDFPMPRDTFTPNKRQTSYKRSEDVEKSTLHVLIRNENECSIAKEVREFDILREKCIKEKMDMSRDEKKAYKDLIREAKTEVLEKAEIILCTCHTSSGTTLEVTNIRQVIIDECGMCTEPEAMIPIVTCRPEQVVLIGDHKQLRPVVIDRTAGKLGLETSLFQRYSRKAHMLTKQYRMHEAIAEFPSKHFYDNKLICGTQSQMKNSSLRIWPNGWNKPIAFLHVVGKEESLKVSTAEGSEQSKSNADEVMHTVRIAFHLVNNCWIKPKDILILTQYRAQRARIEELLAQKALKGVNVSTVISAQGSECDYVILSTVRSLPKSQIDRKPSRSWFRRNLGFIADENQMNVALTRAKKGLVIIGNKNLLESHPMWRKLIGVYREHRKLLDAENFCRVQRKKPVKAYT